MSINLIENINFSCDDIDSFRVMLRTVLTLAYPAPNNTADECNHIKLVVPPNSYGYWGFNNEEQMEMELVCTVHTYIGNSGVKFEDFPMVSMPNPKKNPDYFKKNVWSEHSYQKVLDRIMQLVRANDKPKTDRPEWMDDGDGSTGHGFYLYFDNNILYVAKKHVYYSK